MTDLAAVDIGRSALRRRRVLENSAPNRGYALKLASLIELRAAEFPH